MGRRPSKRAKRTPPSTPEGIAADTGTPSAETFWDEHVSHRKPKLLNSVPKTKQWNTDAWLEGFPHYLKDRAGNCEVNVECREGVKRSFGVGRKTRMQFGAFLDRIVKGDTSLYLTTQEPEWDDEHGVPRVLSPLMEKLSHDFPAVPEVLGSLVPHQVNLWIGAAPEGSSSGLHHDYHDNLYCLLRGRKRFRIFPPALVRQMHTHGEICTIHPNGRIVYKGQEGTRADGATERQAGHFDAKRAAEKELAAAEAECKRQKAQKGTPTSEAQQRLEKAEEKLEQLMEDGLNDFDDGESSGEDEDGCEENLGEGPGLEEGPDEGEGDNADDVSEAQIYSACRPRNTPWAAAKHLAADAGNQGESDSFSRVHDLDRDDAALKERYPQFPGKAAATEITVNEGQMLYLPAGWFHEVTSYGQQHIALSYWMHPPDNLTAGNEGFKRPYTSNFWPETWRALQDQVRSCERRGGCAAATMRTSTC